MNALEKTIALQQKEIEELKNELEGLFVELVCLNCQMKDGKLDSMAISTNADAMRRLADLGKIKITSEYGRRVIGEWVK